MNPLRVIIASMQPDLVADLVAQGMFAAVKQRADIDLLADRVLAADEVACAMAGLDERTPCALIYIDNDDCADERSLEPLLDSSALMVVRIVPDAYAIRVDARNVGIEALLSAVAMLSGQPERPMQERSMRLPWPSCTAAHGQAAPVPGARPLLAAAIAWIHALMSHAVEQRRGLTGDLPGLTVSHEAVRLTLDSHAPIAAPGQIDTVGQAEEALASALDAADADTEPLAALYSKLGLDLLEWKLVLLAMAPELDRRYQTCIGFLLDDMGQRAGTLALYAEMLGDATDIRRRLAAAGGLAQWRLLGHAPGAALPSDQPQRVDPCIVDWLLGQGEAIGHDPQLRHALRPLPWRGAPLLRRPLDRADSAHLFSALREGARWQVLAGADPAGWRALLELGAQAQGVPLLRCELARLAGADRTTVEEIAVRLARQARLAGHAVVLDAALPDWQPADADLLQTLLASLAGCGVRCAIVSPDPARVLAAVGPGEVSLRQRPEADAKARAAAVLAAAHDLGLALDIESASGIGAAFPLRIDGVALAAGLAAARAQPGAPAGELRETLCCALRETAAHDITPLAHRIVPRFELDDVVLPPERHAQLTEIVANVRLAPQVLDEWRFGEKMPYGRGVAVLFHGASGTGKTMAAQAVARELGIDMFALDLSRVVSKFIGETEKNIDAVFSGAQRSGAAVLVDEADALFGKRSEVKDAHDRYANIEVAYLLQRMEAFEGLAILTTNVRQNLDTAFLRRLRFVIEFPRPDAQAREAIWRQCLPRDSHGLGADELRLLARKVELSGGHIRQVTLRAAFAAAAEGSLIGMRHITLAMNAELTKLGLPAVNLGPVGKAA